MNNNLLINNFARLTQSPENVAELKKLVLQLAVQGKLTQNWRNSPFEGGKGDVETGTQLLEKIKAEKQELIKQGKLKHQKPLPKIEENEIPFDIPDSWVWTRLGEKSKLVTDGTHYTPKYKPSGRIFLSAQNIKPFRFIPEKHKFVSEEDYQGYIKNKVAEKNDILIARVGAGIGECAKIDKDIEFAFYVSLALVKPFIEYTNSSFIVIYINSPFGYSYSKGNISGISAGNFNLGDIRKMPFPLPPLAEQQAIVSTVESLFEKIDQLHEKSQQKQALQQKTAETLLKRINAQNANLQEDWQLLQTNFGTLINQKQAVKQLRQTILQLAVQGKLTKNWRNSTFEGGKGDVETGTQLLEKIKAQKQELIKQGKLKRQKPLPKIDENEKPFEIPDSWSIDRIGNIFFTTSGGTPSRGNTDYWHGNISWLKSGELTDSYVTKSSSEKITELGFKKSSTQIFPKGTLLIALYGATAGKLGILNFESTTNQAVCGMFKNQFVVTEYLFYYLRSFREKILYDAKGQAQPNISQTYLKNFVFVLPPLAEQKAIVSQVEKLLKMCYNLEQKITESENLNKKLMQTIVKEYT